MKPANPVDVAVVSAEKTKELIGNIAASQIVAAQPPFLRRNVEASLDDHEARLRELESGPELPINGVNNLRQILQRYSLSETNGVHEAISPKLVGLRRDFWEPPSNKAFAILSEIIKMSRKRLRINVTTLKPTRSAHIFDSKEPAGSTRKKHKVLDCRCRLYLAIYGLENVELRNGPAPKRVSKDPALSTWSDAQFRGRLCDDNRYHFDIEQMDAFAIRMDELEKELERDHPKLSHPFRYEVEIKLEIMDLDSATQALGHIKAEKPVYDSMEPLVATWSELPQFPPQQPRHLKVRQLFKDGKINSRRPIDYGFTVDMAWVEDSGVRIRAGSSESLLATYNHLRRTQEAGTLPTPVSTPTPSTGTPNHKRSTSGPGLVAVKPITLEYIYSEKRTVIVKGLRCVICEREYLHLDRLKQHFEIWHNENYTVLQEGEQNIKIIVEDEPRGRGLRAKKRTNLWEKDTSCERLFIAPNKPFDIKRSLRDRAVARQEEEDEEEDQDEDQDETALADGEDSGGEDSAESEEKMNGSQDSSVGTPSVECVTRVAQPVKRRPKTPENDIMQIPIRQRRKVAVPRNPPDKGAQPSRYFTATTKRFLEPGELLSESDDEYPMDWSQEASNDAISKRTDLSEAAKEFHKSMDAHLTTENVIADLYLGDAIIRWLEKPSSRSIISKDDGRAAFLDWLYEVQNFVKPTDFRHCIDTVSRALPLGRRSRALSSATHISDSEMMDEEVSAVGGAELGANNQDKEQRKLEHCKCGQIANSIADCISCCNDDCAFPDYHLDCVALTDYQIGWRCQNCIS